jgi:hypothetical protein
MQNYKSKKKKKKHQLHTFQYGKSYKTFQHFTPCSLDGSPIPPALPPTSSQDLYFTTHANCSSIMTIFSLGHVSNCPLK